MIGTGGAAVPLGKWPEANAPVPAPRHHAHALRQRLQNSGQPSFPLQLLYLCSAATMASYFDQLSPGVQQALEVLGILPTS
jgi:hypothetical protein